MASWRIKVAAIAVAGGTLALSSWSGSIACQAEDQEQTSKKGTAAEEAVIEVESIPHYTELLEWANDVKRPGFELLKAAKQSGYLIAVFKTEDGDVAICHRRLEGIETAVANSMEVTDLDGNDLDDNSESHHGKSLVRTLKTPKSTIRFFDGLIYALRRPVPKKVRVRFNEGDAEAGLVPDRHKAIFNEIIEME